MIADPEAEADQIARLTAWRETRDNHAVETALDALRDACESGANVMPASIAAAKAGATTGEWGDVVRRHVRSVPRPHRRVRPHPRTAPKASTNSARRSMRSVGNSVSASSSWSASRASTAIPTAPNRLPPAPGTQAWTSPMKASASPRQKSLPLPKETGAHVIGLSILSGSHLPLIEETLAEMRDAGLGDITGGAVGGIIPEEDAEKLQGNGNSPKVYTPKDFELNRIMFDIVALADARAVAAE